MAPHPWMNLCILRRSGDPFVRIKASPLRKLSTSGVPFPRLWSLALYPNGTLSSAAINKRPHPYRYRRHIRHSYRRFNVDAIPTVLLPPLIFTALLLALWTYKCIAMIVFQNKIIYMPFMPPFSRSERIEDYAKLCWPVVWREQRIRSGDGIEVALAVGDLEGRRETDFNGERIEVVILYFQGNGGSTPPRLPGLSQVLTALSASSKKRTKYTIAALSYRGFWNSHGRPSETGIKLDAAAALAWVVRTYPQVSSLIIWGQSIGAGVATTAAAAYQGRVNGDAAQSSTVTKPAIDGLILETPFTSVRAMLRALYPQKWLPYQYLHPFLRNYWDSEEALERLAQTGKKPRALILQGEEDEIVPSSHGKELEEVCKTGDIAVDRTAIKGALHHEVLAKSQGRRAVVDYIQRLVAKG